MKHKVFSLMSMRSWFPIRNTLLLRTVLWF